MSVSSFLRSSSAFSLAGSRTGSQLLLESERFSNTEELGTASEYLAILTIPEPFTLMLVASAGLLLGAGTILVAKAAKKP